MTTGTCTATTSILTQQSNKNHAITVPWLETSERLLRFRYANDKVDQSDMACRSSQLIGAALSKRIQYINENTCDPGDEDAFFVADLGVVYRQHMRWKKLLGRVKPHYAVKCNPDPEVLRLLAKLGTGFDCASKAEIETVLDLGIDSSRIIYAQPCKTKSYTRFAKSNNVRQMTFDNADELHKIATIFPEAELFLRILTDDSTSTCRLSQKFGAALDATAGLFSLAKDLDLNVVGVAFHVGSGASDPYAFSKAVLDARSVFDQGLEYGFDLNTLDVGGGFCTETFDVMAADLAQALDDHFPSSVRIIGEPGRFYVSSAFTIAVNVIARRTIEQDKSYMLYINDGVYGNFSSIIFDHQQPVPRVLASDGVMQYPAQDVAPTEGKAIEYSIWGPTCDGLDCITSKWYSDRVLSVGDWLYFEDMGAYTKCSATRFNGFTDAHDTIYLCSEKGASELLAS